MKTTPARPARKSTSSRLQPTSDQALESRVEETLAWLRRHATQSTRDGMARFGLPFDNALGVAMGDIQALAKQLGRDHALALALWDTGIYEARLLTAYVDEVDKVSATQMDRWCKDFDNWGVCDTVCFALWVRSPLAWKKVPKWAGSREEFVKRAGFVMLACLARHDSTGAEAPFLDGLALIEREAGDPRNFVKKGINWALRAIGGKRDPVLKTAAMEVATRLAASDDATRRWVGKDALRQLGKAAAKKTPIRKTPATRASRKAR